LVTVGVGVLPVVDGALVGVEGALVGVAVTLGLGETLGLGLGDELSLGPAETLAVRLDKALDIELWVLSHPATMHPRARIAAKRTRPLVKRRMPDPSARAFKAGCFGRPLALMILLTAQRGPHPLGRSFGRVTRGGGNRRPKQADHRALGGRWPTP
ncbi:MAG TPA: hypothetical protein VKG61_11500, partial [Streptosporangiaceae bacterium]|nr:hypothetical protein [Streptosporangiaceae bacterium]